MGTNFYLKNGQHIGKRSAAGLYCWDCGETLCQGGSSGIHKGTFDWYSECPSCHANPRDETLGNSSGGVELGFAKPHDIKDRHGVTSASSFCWALHPYQLIGKRKVDDEYGHTYTLRDFRDTVLSNCPMQFYDLVGREFS